MTWAPLWCQLPSHHLIPSDNRTSLKTGYPWKCGMFVLLFVCVEIPWNFTWLGRLNSYYILSLLALACLSRGSRRSTKKMVKDWIPDELRLNPGEHDGLAAAAMTLESSSNQGQQEKQHGRQLFYCSSFLYTQWLFYKFDGVFVARLWVKPENRWKSYTLVKERSKLHSSRAGQTILKELSVGLSWPTGSQQQQLSHFSEVQEALAAEMPLPRNLNAWIG